MRTHRIQRTLVVVAVLLVAGCQSLRTGGTDEPMPDDDPVIPGDADPGDPADPGAPLLQIDVSGGFVMMGYDFSTVPSLTVYADGRAIVHGPQILIDPGPALPNLLVSTTDTEALIGAALDAGLLGDAPDYGQPSIADAPSTFVTITVDGQTYRHAANALDITADSAGDLGLTDGQMAARSALAAFVAETYAQVGDDGEPYDISAFGIMGWPVTAETVDPVPQVLPWPVDLPLADAADCTLVDGADAATLLETLEEATQTTLFEQDGTTYEMHFRPLLPHETGCEDLIPG